MAAAKHFNARSGGAGFFSKGLLLALPVVVLTLFGILSLRQDRKVVEGEVRERAQSFANEMAERCRQRVITIKRGDSIDPPRSRDTKIQAFTGLFRVSKNGDLLLPAPVQSVPSPAPAMVSQLNQEQAELWHRIEADQSVSAAGKLTAFLATHPPAEFEARARFRLGIALTPNDTKGAINEFQTIIDRFSDSIGETGISLPTLAAMQLMETGISSNQGQSEEIRSKLNQIGSEAVARPTALTPWILSRIANWEERLLGGTNLSTRWNDSWAMDERHRSVYAAVQRSLLSEKEASASPTNHSWPEWFWFRCDDAIIIYQGEPEYRPKNAVWLAAACKKFDDDSRLYVYRDYIQWRELLDEFDSVEAALPPCLGAYYRIAGRTFPGIRLQQVDPYAAVIHKMGNPLEPGVFRTTQNTMLTLFASARHYSGGRELCQVAVVLIDPMQLYARQRERVRLFGCLIGVSVLVSVFGLAALRAAFRRQQRLYEMQSNFVSSVTHELRAPIGAVRLMAENLNRNKVPDPQEQRKVFDCIVQECARLSSMIENVLKLARIEQGRQEYEYEETDVARLVQDTVALMTSHAAARQVRIEMQMPPSTPNPEGAVLDGRAIQQLLINLIDNAIKHSPPGSRIQVGVEWMSRGSNPAAPGNSGAPASLRFWVADQGPGIPVGERHKIFDRFYRLGSELRRETSGAGIGLSIVKHIVQAHGGEVWVEDASGGGSRFVVKLPVILRAAVTRH